MPPPKPADIDAYIAAAPEQAQAALGQLRAAIRKAAPRATEGISYAIPAFHQDGGYLIYFAGYRHHVSLYPQPKGDAALLEALEPYRAGKGTLQFPLDRKLPLALITRVVKARLKEHAEKAKGGKT